KACGSTQSQNLRRARAVGEIARREATLALPQPDAAPDSAPDSASGSGSVLSVSSGSAPAQSPSGQAGGPETSQGASNSHSTSASASASASAGVGAGGGGAPAPAGRQVQLIVHLDA